MVSFDTLCFPWRLVDGTFVRQLLTHEPRIFNLSHVCTSCRMSETRLQVQAPYCVLIPLIYEVMTMSNDKPKHEKPEHPDVPPGPPTNVPRGPKEPPRPPKDRGVG